MNSMFVTESEVNEAKIKKQENWDKTRRPDQPLLAPEEVLDHRSLFEQLKEHKDKKDNDWEEAHMFKNQIRGLESEEVAFINAVDEQKEEVERQKKKEEQELINEFRTRNSKVIRVPSMFEQLGLDKKGPVRRKRPAAEEAKVTSKKRKFPTTISISLRSETSNKASSSNKSDQLDTTNNNTNKKNNTTTKKSNNPTNSTNKNTTSNTTTITTNNNTTKQPITGIQVIGALPSLVPYAASDEEESQSDTDTSDDDDDEPTFNTVQILRRPQKSCKQ